MPSATTIHSQEFRQRDDCSHDLAVFAAGFHFADERAIDL
jgi:hypothetical protein